MLESITNLNHSRKILLIVGLSIAILIPLILLITWPSPEIQDKKGNVTISPTMIALPSQQPTLVPQTQDQGAADKNFSDQIVKDRAAYPWYSSLPLRSNDYFVYFDLEEKVLVAKIYDKSNNLSPQNIDLIKANIEQQLRSLGISVIDYPTSWRTGF